MWRCHASPGSRTLPEVGVKCGHPSPWYGFPQRATWFGIVGGEAMKLEHQIALITGGSRGIGRATALLFAQEGADIAFCHLDDDAQADTVAAEIRAPARRAMPRSVDVADIVAARAFAGAAAAGLGPIDILFNNAGMN